MMPNKTIYVADTDMPVFEKAQALVGGNLSAAIAQAIRQFVADRESDRGATIGEVILTVSEQGIPTKKRFRGQFIAEQRVRTPDGARTLLYRIYRSEKGKFVIWSRSAPAWESQDRSTWTHRSQAWNADWWRGEMRLDSFDTLDDLQGNIPESLYARVQRFIATGSDIEELDV